MEKAVDEYCSAVSGRKGIFRRGALYDRPLFVVCGSHKSGKTSLLQYSDLPFPLVYPPEDDEILRSESIQVRWYCSDSAVWVDTPGVFSESSYTVEWNTFCSSLKNIRKKRPVDGLILVVSLKEVTDSDSKAVHELATRLRSVIDSMIVKGGVEFPVYLVISKTDEIAGFREYFAEQILSDREYVLGAVLDCSSTAQPAKKRFAARFSDICTFLRGLRTDKLLNTNDSREREMICRFALEFQCLGDKLNLLVGELFRKSEYGGDPVFRSFFFTGLLKEPGCTDAFIESNSTGLIIGTGTSGDFGADSYAVKRKGIISASPKSAFVSSLFREVIPEDKHPVRLNFRQRRRRQFQTFAAATVLSLSFLSLSGLVFLSGLQNLKYLNSLKNELESIPAEAAEFPDNLVRLEMLRRVTISLQEKADRSVLLEPGGFLFRFDGISDLIKPIYMNEANKLVINPVCKYLEYDIHRMSGYSGEIAGDRYEKLYNSLKVYLSLAQEGGLEIPLDTLLSGSLLRASAERIFRLSAKSEKNDCIRTVLDENIGTCLFYLKRGEFPLFPKSERIVQNARQRLNCKPGTKAIYDNLNHRLVSEAPVVTLDHLLGRTNGDAVLKSDHTISTIYTQNGWDQFVLEAFREAAEDPFRNDWVVGKGNVSVQIDSESIMNELTRLYADDFIREWLSFIENIHFEKMAELNQCSQLLGELSAANSDLTRLFAGLCRYTRLGSADQNELRSESVSSIKKQVGQLGEKLPVLNQAPSKTDEKFTHVQAMFSPLRTFSEEGMDRYRKNASLLENSISGLESATDKDIAAAFSIPEKDPFLCFAADLKTILESMPAELSSSLYPLLSEPMEQSASSAEVIFKKALNSCWKKEIHKSYMERIHGRYPFLKSGPDVTLGDFEEFFRPGTGILWSFYNVYLNIHLIRTSEGWIKTNYDNGFKLTFNDQIGCFLNTSEKISNIFFRSDGTRKQMEIVVHPSVSEKERAQFIFGDEQYQILPGGNPFILYWPSRTPIKTAALRIGTGESAFQQISYQGNWGLMKLFEAARLQNLSSSVQIAKWQVNMQNLYALQLKVRILTSSESPFNNSVFEKFECPVDLFQN